MLYSKYFEIVFSWNDKDNSICPFLPTIRLSYNICFDQCMPTSNSKHRSFLNKKIMKIPTQKGEHSCKCSELSFKRKEGMLALVEDLIAKNLWRTLLQRIREGPYSRESMENLIAEHLWRTLLQRIRGGPYCKESVKDLIAENLWRTLLQRIHGGLHCRESCHSCHVIDVCLLLLNVMFSILFYFCCSIISRLVFCIFADDNYLGCQLREMPSTVFLPFW